MKLAILSYEYPPDTGFGGIGTYSYYHARALVRLGHEVHVFAGATESGVSHSEHDGVRVTRTLRDGWVASMVNELHGSKCHWAATRINTGFNAFSGLRHALEREQFDFVEMPECGADGLFVSTLLTLPTAVKLHSPARLIMGYYDTPLRDREMTAFLEQVAINQANVVLSCSRFLADEARVKMGVGAPIQVIPNGIDLELFDRDDDSDSLAELGIPDGATTVFFANRLERRKGIHVAIDAALLVLARHDDVHFVFAGDYAADFVQATMPRLEASGVADRCHFLGRLDLPRVRAILKRIDVFLISSLWENCPYSCIEAMAARRAIVASDCGGLPELIVDGDTGLLARSNDAASFLAALERALGDAELRRSLGSRARAVVEERLTDLAIAKRTAAAYQKVLDGGIAPDTATRKPQRAVTRRTLLAGSSSAACVGDADGAHSAVVVERDALRTERDRLVERCDALAGERDQARDRLQEARTIHQQEVEKLRGSPEWRTGDLLRRKIPDKVPLGQKTVRAVDWSVGRAKKWFGKTMVLVDRTSMWAGRTLKSGKRNPVAVVASCWDFPVHSHTFVYQEMVGLRDMGFDLRVFYCGASGDELPPAFAELDRGKFLVRQVWDAHQADKAWFEKTRPGRLTAFLERVADETGQTVDKLANDKFVLVGCTFARWLERLRASYVHTYFFYDQSFMAMLAASLLDIPRGVSCYSDHMIDDFPFKLVPLHMETASVLVATSKRIRDELLEISGGRFAEKIVVKPNGVDGSRFAVAERQLRPGQRIDMVSVSRIEEKKGLVHLVDVVEDLTREGYDVHVHMVGCADPYAAGSTEYEERLRDRIVERNLQARFTLHGRQMTDFVARLLADSQIFVAPYVETESGNKDGIPTAMLEAMAAGLPIATTDAGSILEVVDDGIEGVVVSHTHPRRLAAAIAALLDDPESMLAMGRRARARFEREFDISVTERKLHERIRRVLPRETVVPNAGAIPG